MGSATYEVGTSCQAYMGVDVDRGAVQAEFVVTTGVCSVKTPPSPVGLVQPTRPTTVCCQ
jgi:hypothetical protein